MLLSITARRISRERLAGSRKDKGSDVVFEHVGEATWERSLRALRRGGRLVTCGATTGNRGKVNLDALFWNNTHILGNRVGSKGDLLEALRSVLPGQLRPVVDSHLSPGQSGAGTPAAWRRESNLAKSSSCRKENAPELKPYHYQCPMQTRPVPNGSGNSHHRSTSGCQNRPLFPVLSLFHM